MTGIERLHLPADALSALCQQFGVRELCAFGSVLRDDFTVDSDVDFLVVFEPDRAVGLFHLLRLQQRLEELVGRPVDLVPKQGLKPQLRDQVIASAQVVYAA